MKTKIETGIFEIVFLKQKRNWRKYVSCVLDYKVNIGNTIRVITR